MKNSIALARKCRELQSQLKHQSKELVNERKRVEAQKMKEESNHRLFHELTVKKNHKASAYIVSTLNSRDNEISRLERTLAQVNGDLGDVIRERDGLSSKLCQVLERRERLDEIKGLVERAHHKHNEPEDDGEDDMFDHVVHH